MTVAHVFAKTDIGDDEERWQFLFQQTHGLLHDAVASVSAGGFVIFFTGNTKKQNRRHTQRVGAAGFAQQFIGRKLEDAGHRGDGASQFPSVANEER